MFPDRAEKVVSEMREKLQPHDTPQTKPSIIVQWWPKPVIAPGRDSWVQHLMDAVGLVNPLADRAVKSTPLTDEELREYNPDAVVISWCGVKYDKYHSRVIYRNPLWQDTKVRHKPERLQDFRSLSRPPFTALDGWVYSIEENC